MPVLEIQIPWSAVARPIIGGDEPGYIYIYIYITYIYIGWLMSMPIDARSTGLSHPSPIVHGRRIIY